MPADGPRTVDVLRYETPDGPSYRAIESGRGQDVVEAHEQEVQNRRRLRWAILLVAAIGAAGLGVLYSNPFTGSIAAVVVLVAGFLTRRQGDHDDAVPELVERNMYRERAAEEYDLDVTPRQR